MDYNRVAKYFKPFIPIKIRKSIRIKHQNYIFEKAIKEFKNKHHQIENHPEILQNLIYGWGNIGWSAMHDYLLEVLLSARKSKGIILECGSGLSSILISIVIEGTETKLISLEHQETWGNRVKHIIDKHKLSNVTIAICPIIKYEKFDWYDVKSIKFEDSIDMVVCDGPPSNTRGARVGLMPLMNKHLAKNAIILMDDYARDTEKDVIMEWKKTYNFSIKEKGSRDLYAILKIM